MKFDALMHNNQSKLSFQNKMLNYYHHYYYFKQDFLFLNWFSNTFIIIYKPYYHIKFDVNSECIAAHFGDYYYDHYDYYY